MVEIPRIEPPPRAVSPEPPVRNVKKKEKQRVGMCKCRFVYLLKVSDLSLEEMKLMKSLERLEELCKQQKEKILAKQTGSKPPSRPSSSQSSKSNGSDVQPTAVAPTPKREKPSQIPNKRVRNRNRNPVLPQQVRPVYGKVK